MVLYISVFWGAVGWGGAEIGSSLPGINPFECQRILNILSDSLFAKSELVLILYLKIKAAGGPGWLSQLRD